MTHRLEYIDQLKGLAMLLVVIGHIIVFCGLGYENTLIRHITMMNMPLFFLLNGLVVKNLITTKDMGRKCAQLLLPFFVWGALISLFRNQSYLDFLQHYWKFGYWYLLVLFEFFVIQFALSHIRQFANRNNHFWIDIIIFLIVWKGLQFSARFIPTDINGYIDYYQAIDYLPFFCLGGFIKQYRLMDKMHQYANIIITTLIILLLPLYILWQGGGSVTNTLLPCVIILLLLLLFSSFEKTNNLQISAHPVLLTTINSVFATIGKHTLTIYMTQFFLFRYISFDALFPMLYQNNNYFAIILIAAATAIPLCYFCILVEYMLNKSRILSYVMLGKSWRKQLNNA